VILRSSTWYLTSALWITPSHLLVLVASSSIMERSIANLAIDGSRRLGA
jgi:hypothetical protein